jgi:hypothetical protein
MTDNEEKTIALRAVVSFHSLTENDIIHVHPDDEHYLSLMEIGLLVPAYPEDDPKAQATVLASNEQGETTTILGVRPARQRRSRRTDAAAVPPSGSEDVSDKVDSDGEADPE